MSIKFALLSGFLTFWVWAQAQNRELYQRDLSPYLPNKNVQARIFHRQDSSFLVVDAAMQEFMLTLRIYDEYNERRLLNEQFLNSQKLTFYQNQTLVHLPVAADKKLWAVEVQINGNGFNYYDILWANRAQENEQAIFILQNGAFHLRKFVSTAQNYSLAARDANVNQFYIKFFPNGGNPAKAIYINETDKFNPLKGYEELIRVEAGKNFVFNKEGVYFIQTDSSSNKGCFILAQNPDFPRPMRLEDLLQPLRYISKNAEFDKINNATDKKTELDAFWLARHKDKERARQLLKLYYQRTEEANFYFSTHKAGWQTDKGLLYIIFGAPDVVRKFSAKEVWFYKEKNNRQPVEFVFERVGELFYLERDRAYRNVWDIEIERWRKGKI